MFSGGTEMEQWLNEKLGIDEFTFVSLQLLSSSQNILIL